MQTSISLPLPLTVRKHVNYTICHATHLKNGREGVRLGSLGFTHYLYGPMARFLPHIDIIAFWTYLKSHGYDIK
jgi:hypothetical protein